MALFRKMLFIFGLLAFVSSLILATPTIARAVSSEENINTTTIQSDETSDTDDSSSRNRVNDEAVETNVQSIRQKAEKLVADERKTRVKLDDDTRQQLCNNRKNAIENKVNAFGNAADAHLNRLDGVLDKLSTYLTANPNGDVKLEDATAAQGIAAKKVASLQKLIGDGTVDCSKLTDNASWLTGVRTAATEARDALKAYRTELKKVVVALQQTTSSTSQDATTESTTNTNTTDEQ